MKKIEIFFLLAFLATLIFHFWTLHNIISNLNDILDYLSDSPAYQVDFSTEKEIEELDGNEEKYFIAPLNFGWN